MPIDATIGGASSNSYISRVEADNYFLLRLGADVWNSEGSNTIKESALVTATQRIEQLSFLGVRASRSQALKFPRAGAPLADDDFYDGYGDLTYSTNEIPALVKQATCEMALVLLTDTQFLGVDDLKQFEQINLPGGLSFKIRADYEAGGLPAQVERILAPLMASRSGMLLRS